MYLSCAFVFFFHTINNQNQMKNWMLATLLAVFSFTSLLAGPGKAPTTKTVNPAKSEFVWVGKKVTGQHDGKVKIKSGSIQMDGNKITGGRFVMDMRSITVEDIKDPESNGKLLGHLKSEDFFGVDKHPEATFVIKEATPLNKNQTTITGDLTIKGKTHTVSFPATVMDNRAKAEFEVDRTKWDIRYGSGSFFDDLGDKAIYDDFTVKLDLVLE